MAKIDYKQAGVDIDAGNESVERIKQCVKETHTKNVLTGLGSFGSLFSLKDVLKNYDDPVLVQSIDGVGTKTIVANMAKKYENLGRDLFSATCNDIIVMGAKPLTFLDYIAFDKLSPSTVQELVSGMSKACCESNVSLVGGETAEMPNVYLKNEIDVVGIITGVVEKENIINGKDIVAGDKVYAINSSGLHTNGFSLARKILFDIGGFKIDDKPSQLQGATIGYELLQYHINYTNPIHKILDDGIHIKGMAHITGGGIIENIPRVLPDNLTVEIDTNSWNTPNIFNLIQETGSVDNLEMHRAFNMGVGIVIIGDKTIENKLQNVIQDYPTLTLNSIGDVVVGNEVKLLNL